MDPKSILLSKTLWANVIAFIAALLGAHHVVVDPDTQATLVAGVMAVLNIALRLVTKQPVTLTGSSPAIAMLFAGALGILAACSTASTPAVVATGIEAAPGAISTASTLFSSSATPQQKFTAACDEYWAGSAQLGPMIQALAAKQGATTAKAYQAAQVALSTACTKNPDGTYLNAASPSLATLIPQVLGAAGQLTVLFLSDS